jgi:hypothetical protein
MTNHIPENEDTRAYTNAQHPKQYALAIGANEQKPVDL